MSPSPPLTHHILWPEFRRFMENADQGALEHLLAAARAALESGRPVLLVQPADVPGDSPVILRSFTDLASLEHYRRDIDRALRIARDHRGS